METYDIITNIGATTRRNTGAEDFDERVRINERKLVSELKSHYDFIVCGSGSAGSVVARRLAENPDVSVLLLEPGGNDDVPSVMDAKQWASDLASIWDWDFEAQPNPHLNGRVVSMSMGKVLGGGPSINAMAWARGHQNDWDYVAAEARDSAWNYEAVVDRNLKVYGIQNLRTADASIMPGVVTGNTMATCVISHRRRTSERDPAELHKFMNLPLFRPLEGWRDLIGKAVHY